MTTLHFKTVAPFHVTTESLVADWTVPVMSVFDGYSRDGAGGVQASYHPLTKAELTREWIGQVRSWTFLKHRTYKIFARYRMHGSRRVYDGLLVRDADELTARSGHIVQVAEVAL